MDSVCSELGQNSPSMGKEQPLFLFLFSAKLDSNKNDSVLDTGSIIDNHTCIFSLITLAVSALCTLKGWIN